LSISECLLLTLVVIQTMLAHLKSLLDLVEVIEEAAMSASGTKQTSNSKQLMSAFGGKADIPIALRNVRL
jgi:hypothetical protein